MEAQILIDLMVRVGVRPDVISYNILIDGHCLVGGMDETMKLLGGMVSVGLKPNVVTYSILLHGFCKAGRIDDASSLFRETTELHLELSLIERYCTVYFRTGDFLKQRNSISV
uniref:Pentatricopeptide repeat-containing protein n=1 Tax=Arundo donax TaxID=35708 RepID=A0A0A9FCP6_ARUDO